MVLTFVESVTAMSAQPNFDVERASTAVAGGRESVGGSELGGEEEGEVSVLAGADDEGEKDVPERNDGTKGRGREKEGTAEGEGDRAGGPRRRTRKQGRGRGEGERREKDEARFVALRRCWRKFKRSKRSFEANKRARERRGKVKPDNGNRLIVAACSLKATL
jgi:hypothetical protein